MKRLSQIDWSGAALVAVAIALALVGTFTFGSHWDKFATILVAIGFLLALLGRYSMNDRDN